MHKLGRRFSSLSSWNLLSKSRGLYEASRCCKHGVVFGCPVKEKWGWTSQLQFIVSQLIRVNIYSTQRADVLSLTLLEKVSEGDHVINALEKNGYPRNLIRRRHRQQHSVTPITTEQPSTRVTLPYIQGQSEAIRRVLKKLDIQKCFTPVTTLKQIL